MTLSTWRLAKSFSRPVVYVFEISVKTGYTAEQYAEAWVEASRIIQRSPGALGTRLHRNLEDDTKLIAIASWDTKENRDQSAAVVNGEVQDIIASQAPFVDIRVIGEFADPEWVVDPS